MDKIKSKRTILIFFIVLLLGLFSVFIIRIFKSDIEKTVGKGKVINESKHNLDNRDNEIDLKIKNMVQNNVFEEYSTGLLQGYEDNKIDSIENAPVSVVHNGKAYYRKYSYLDQAHIDVELTSSEERDITMCKIINMTDEFAIAIKDSKKNIFYPYISDEYNPKTMEVFLQDTGFGDEIVASLIQLSCEDKNCIVGFYDGYEEYWFKSMYELAEHAIITDYADEKLTGFSINYNMNHIKEKVYMSFYESGKIRIRFENSLEVLYFDAGDKGIVFATEMMEYLAKNSKGYMLKYDK